MRGMSLNGDGDGDSLRVSLLSDPAPVFNPRAERYAQMLADAEQCGEGDGSKQQPQPPQPEDEASERANMALYFVSLAKHARLPVHGTMRDYKFFHSATYRLCYFGVVALLLAIPLWTPASATDPTRSRGAHWARYLWLEAALLVAFFFDVRLQHKVMGGDSFWASSWIRLKVGVLAGVLVNLLVNTTRHWPVYFMRPFMSLLLVERAKNVRRILENATLVLPRVVFVAIPMALVLIFAAAFAYVLFRGVDTHCMCRKLGLPTNSSCSYARQYDWHEEAYSYCSVFSQNCRDYYKSLGDALVHLFHMAMTVNNPDVTLPAYGCSPYSQVFFQVYMLTAYYFLMSLVLAVVYSSFQELHAKVAAQMANRRVYAMDAAFRSLAAAAAHTPMERDPASRRVPDTRQLGSMLDSRLQASTASISGSSRGVGSRLGSFLGDPGGAGGDGGGHGGGGHGSGRFNAMRRTLNRTLNGQQRVDQDVHLSFVIDAFEVPGEGKAAADSDEHAARSRSAGGVGGGSGISTSSLLSTGIGGSALGASGSLGALPEGAPAAAEGAPAVARAAARAPAAPRSASSVAAGAEAGGAAGAAVRAVRSASAPAPVLPVLAEPTPPLPAAAAAGSGGGGGGDRTRLPRAAFENFLSRLYPDTPPILWYAIFLVVSRSRKEDAEDGGGGGLRAAAAPARDHITRLQFQELMPFVRLQFIRAPDGPSGSADEGEGGEEGDGEDGEDGEGAHAVGGGATRQQRVTSYRRHQLLRAGSTVERRSQQRKEALSRRQNSALVRWCRRVVLHPRFDPSMDSLVVLSSCLLYYRLAALPAESGGRFLATSTDPWNVTFAAFLALFVAELAVRLTAAGFRHFWKARATNRLDFVIIGLALGVYGAYTLGLAAEEEGSLVYAVVLLLRVVRILRPLSNSTRYQTFSRTVRQILPGAARYAGAAFSVYYAFAVLGMELFAFRVTRCVDAAQTPVQCAAVDNATGESYSVDNSDAAALFCLKRGLISVDNGNRATLALSCNIVVQQTAYATANYWYMHFNDLGSSMIVLFQLTVVNNWPLIEEGHLAATSQFHRLYFLAFWIAMVVIMFNLLASFLLDAFSATFARNEMLKQRLAATGRAYVPPHMKRLRRTLRELGTSWEALNLHTVHFDKASDSVLLVDSEAAYDDHHVRSLAWVKYYEANVADLANSSSGGEASQYAAEPSADVRDSFLEDPDGMAEVED